MRCRICGLDDDDPHCGGHEKEVWFAHYSSENEKLRDALRALVDALPKCPGDAPDWQCGKPATMVFTGADSDESYCCPEHAYMGSEEPCAWAKPLRLALHLLNDTRGSTPSEPAPEQEP